METTSGYGTGLHYGDGLLASDPTYTEITNVDSVDPPNLTIGVTELQPLKAVNRAVIKKPNWKNANDSSVSMFYDKTQMAALYALSGVEKAWKVDKADGAITEFDGFISDFGQPEINGDGELMIEFTITASGLPVFTEAPAA